ncbi:2-hydroxyacid dehydrogenase [uncultured Ilyobacter sp.]|uniref:2-hydroxyacid dehydrogenase n=1 Tax=uncultured Ilyobacter sp. TaxID=544433 RepID=UPI0029C89142|nr:2-hydroxyacid dehydrogenase [uncultured Ilyobacter sp.]
MLISIYLWKELDHFKKAIENLGKEFPYVEIKTYFTKEEKDYGDSDVILAVDMTLEEAKKASKMKAIFVPYTGLDEFPQKYLEERKVEIYHSYAKSKYVAERALTLALGIMGKVTEYDLDMRRGNWGPRTGGKNRWETLFDKRCALLGIGHIGQNIASLLKPFTEEIYTLDRGKRYTDVKKYFKTVEELAENCDVFFLSLPLNENTEGIIDEKILNKLNGKYLINVGRGKTVEEKALYESLRDGNLKGAGIEVWYDYPDRVKKECFPSKYPFQELENIIMSPHVATFSKEDVWIYFDDIMEQLKNYIRKQEEKK